MRKLVLVLALAAFALAACGGGEEAAPPPAEPPAEPAEPPPAEPEPPAETEEPAPSETEPAPPAETEEPDACAKDVLALESAGRLTIGTGNPAFDPWFSGGSETEDWEFNDPHNGQGYEGAFAYALAERLGFSADEVDWVAIGFNQSFAPGPKKFDFVLQQISYGEKRDRNVDFSVSYYDVNQALVSYAGSPIDGAASFADLKSAKLGVPVGTTSFDYVVDNIQPDVEPAVYDDQAAAVQALKNKQVDGIVTDLPTAFFLVAVEIDDGIIVGQFPTVGEQEYFGLAFEEGSALVSCVNAAIDELKADGTLEAIYDMWLAGTDQAPFIEG
jgi:polar amino acid transport system substrate-binding protein